MRNRETTKPTTSWWTVLLLLIGGGIFGWYVTYIGRGIDLTYDEAEKSDTVARTLSVRKLDLGGASPLYVPDLQLYTSNHAWMYVTKSSPLPQKYEPTGLTPITLPTGDKDTSMMLRADVLDRLKQLFDTASQDGYGLMVSSAYRSIADQQTLYNAMTKTRGEAYAKQYVLTPGASEHHTGFAVDVTDASTKCEQDSDDCLLSPNTAAWLADNAADFGFIIRYPSGKESYTGISHEPWHLRYVGVALARQLTENDLTLDEFIEQTAPGRFK